MPITKYFARPAGGSMLKIKFSAGVLLLGLLAACASHPVIAPLRPEAPYAQRMVALQNTQRWQLDGRVAVKVDTQGWTATFAWNEDAPAAELRLAGPFNIGSLVITQSADGLSLNGGPPGDAVTQQLREKFGFDLPLNSLRYWLLGVPDPSIPYEILRNDQDRASRLTQVDWSVEYDKYVAAGDDVLPGHIELTRGRIRVRVVVERWNLAG